MRCRVAGWWLLPRVRSAGSEVTEITWAVGGPEWGCLRSHECVEWFILPEPQFPPENGCNHCSVLGLERWCVKNLDSAQPRTQGAAGWVNRD